MTCAWASYPHESWPSWSWFKLLKKVQRFPWPVWLVATHRRGYLGEGKVRISEVLKSLEKLNKQIKARLQTNLAIKQNICQNLSSCFFICKGSWTTNWSQSPIDLSFWTDEAGALSTDWWWDNILGQGAGDGEGDDDDDEGDDDDDGDDGNDGDINWLLMGQYIGDGGRWESHIWHYGEAWGVQVDHEHNLFHADTPLSLTLFYRPIYYFSLWFFPISGYIMCIVQIS